MTAVRTVPQQADIGISIKYDIVVVNMNENYKIVFNQKPFCKIDFK